MSLCAFPQFLGHAEELFYEMECQPLITAGLGWDLTTRKCSEKNKCVGNAFWRTVWNLFWGFPEALPCWVVLLCVWGVTSALCSSAFLLWPGRLPDPLQTPTMKMDKQLLISLWLDFNKPQPETLNLTCVPTLWFYRHCVTDSNLPVVLQLWFQLLDVYLQVWHLVSSHFQLLHFAETVQDSVSGLFHLPPHLCLLPLQVPVAIFQADQSFLRALQLLLQLLIEPDGFFNLPIPGAPDQLHLLQDTLEALGLGVVWC